MIKISKAEGATEIGIETPYSTEFISRIKQIGGKWSKPYWMVPAKNEELARRILFDVFGEDGTPGPTVTLLANLDLAVPGYQDRLLIGGREALVKRYRDKAPDVGPDCAIVAGKLHNSGGSRNNPHITHDPGTILRIENVPVAVAEKLVAEWPEGAYMIVEPGEMHEEEGGTPVQWTNEEISQGIQNVVEMLRQFEIVGDRDGYQNLLGHIDAWAKAIS